MREWMILSADCACYVESESGRVLARVSLDGYGLWELSTINSAAQFISREKAMRAVEEFFANADRVIGRMYGGKP